MDDELSKRVLQENIIAVRWLRYFDFHQQYGVPFSRVKAGQEYTESAFLSTSLWLRYLGGYDTAKRDLSKHIMLIIEIPKGVNCIYPTKDITNRDEYELIISRGQSLIVKKILYHFHTTAIVVCKIKQ